MSAFSIYIPSVYPNITEQMISHTFNRMDVGCVQHVELVEKDNKCNKAYVYFKSLYKSDLAMSIYEDLSNNRTAKLSYARNEHVFWILLSCRREYDGLSNKGEYIAPGFTKEELDFMETHMSDYSYVSSDYAQTLETELYNLRNQFSAMQHNQITLFNHYNTLLAKYNDVTGSNSDTDGKGKMTIDELSVEEGQVVEAK